MNWIVSNGCNGRCPICLDLKQINNDSSKILDIAKILVDWNIKKITLSGEPTIVNNLNNALRILKNNDVKLNYHTNGILLAKEPERLDELSSLVDLIALPIDSTNRENQLIMRGYNFLPVLDNIINLSNKIISKNIKLGYHTVFTEINSKDIIEIYDLIKKVNFNYWKIYEYNYYLNNKKLVKSKNQNEMNLFKDMDDLENEFNYLGLPKIEHIDSTYAKFLFCEDEFRKIDNNKIKFIEENSKEYIFLNNNGNLTYHFAETLHSEDKFIGNIFKNSKKELIKKIKEYDKQGSDYLGLRSEEFFRKQWEKPIWIRAYTGEIEEEDLIKFNHYPEKIRETIIHLSKLYEINH